MPGSSGSRIARPLGGGLAGRLTTGPSRSLAFRTILGLAYRFPSINEGTSASVTSRDDKV